MIQWSQNSAGPSTRATRAIALVLALNYSGQNTICSIAKKKILMSNVMTLVFGESWVRPCRKASMGGSKASTVPEVTELTDPHDLATPAR